MTENEIITQQDPQMQMFSQLMQGTLKKVGTLLHHCSPYAWRRGLPHGRGGLQPITAQHTHAPRVQKLRNASFLQNRREDTLQAERHTSHA